MNKRLFDIYTIALLMLFCFVTQKGLSQCRIAQIIQANKAKIPAPYKYDGFSVTEFQFDSINKVVSTEFIAFKGQKYYLVFCSSGFEEEVTVSIFGEAGKKKSEPQKIVEGSVGKSTNNWTFEPPKTGSYTINFNLSPTVEYVSHKECIVMMIGYIGK